MKKHGRGDSIMFAVALLCISGVGLAYNLLSSEGGDIAVSLWDIVDYEDTDVSAISSSAAANLIDREIIAVSAEVMPVPQERELLPPVVRP